MKRGLRLLRLCLAAVMLVGLFLIVRQTREEQVSARSNTEAAEIAGLPDRALPARPSESPQSAPMDSPRAPEPVPSTEDALAAVDLEALRAVNPDVVGWIALPGTEISYPLVQGTDNEYYLSHTWERADSSCGAIFLDCGASGDLTDLHTIVYGHRMRNGTMFTALKGYRDSAFLKEHPSVYVVLDSGVYRYDIFSAREADTMGIVYQRDLEGREGDLLRDCAEGSVISTGVVPEAGERILTLSTCTGTGYARRWTVHAVLRDIREPVEAARQRSAGSANK